MCCVLCVAVGVDGDGGAVRSARLRPPLHDREPRSVSVSEFATSARLGVQDSCVVRVQAADTRTETFSGISTRTLSRSESLTSHTGHHARQHALARRSRPRRVLTAFGLCLQIVKGAVEPSVLKMLDASHIQFERVGYFCQDAEDSKPDALVCLCRTFAEQVTAFRADWTVLCRDGGFGVQVFNRVVTLRDNWSKQAEAQAPKAVRAFLSSVSFTHSIFWVPFVLTLRRCSTRRRRNLQLPRIATSSRTSCVSTSASVSACAWSLQRCGVW